MIHNRVELYGKADRTSLPPRGGERVLGVRIPRRGQAAATLVLEKGEILSLRPSGRVFRVACVAGRLWATEDPSWADHLLAPGEAETFRGRSTVVIQALRKATLRIDSETSVAKVR